MTTTYSSNLKLILMGTGDESGTWGDKTNTNLGTLLEQSIVGYATQTISDNPATPTTLTMPDGVSATARNYVLELTGTLTATRDLVVPAIEKPYTIYNNTSGGFSVAVKVSGQTGVTVANGKKAIVYVNNTDVIEVVNAPVTETGTQTLTNKTLTSPTITGGTINNAVIGGTTPAAGTFSAATVYNATSSAATVQGDATTNIIAQRSSADAVQANVIVRKTRGTVASPAAVQSSDVSGGLSYQVFGGTNYRSIADIIGVVKTYTSDSNISGYLTFLTNSGSTSGTERMRILSSGEVVIGNGETSATPSAGKLQATDGSGTDIAGAALTIQGGRGTGTGAGGSVIIATAAASTTGTSLNSATERFRVGPSGQFGIGGANYGTAGQVLASGGSAAAPSWTSLSTATGNLIRAPQVITSTATTSYTTPSNCTSIYVELVGAGGGGGGSDSASGTTNYAGVGGGGGSGAYAAKYFTVTGSTAYTVAIGTGGTAGSTSGGSGGNGGNTTFTVGATTVTSGGGTGGASAGTVSEQNAIAAGGLGGTATSGDLNISGNVGSHGFAVNSAEGPKMGGSGGSSFFGGSGRGTINGGGRTSGTDVAGSAGTTGSGGGGSTTTSTSGLAGFAGGNGLIRIWEYT